MVMLLRSTSLYTERTMMHFSPDSFRVSLSPSIVVELVELSILRASPFLFELGETTPFSFFSHLPSGTGHRRYFGRRQHTRRRTHTIPPLSLSFAHTHSLSFFSRQQRPARVRCHGRFNSRGVSIAS